MNNERCWGGLDEQFPMGVDEHDPMVLPLDEQDPDRSSRLGLDEQDPVDEQSQVEAGGGRRWR